MSGVYTKIALFVALAAWSLLAAMAAEGAEPAADNPPSVKEMAGQMLLVGFRGLTPPAEAVRDIEQYHLGGVILFDYDVARKSPTRNIADPAQVKQLIADLQAKAAAPLLVAVDQEGGKVRRLRPERGFAPALSLPPAEELGRGEPAATQTAAQALGADLRALGFNFDLAPVADVNVNPDNPAIGRLGRSFSADPAIVAAQARAYAAGLRAAGVISCLKHFPGHGSAYNDSHLGLTDVTDSWSEAELRPFVELIAGGYGDPIMTAHIFNAKLDPELPATLSPAVVEGLLRGQLKHSGVIVTDDLQMKAIAAHYTLEQTVELALKAGNDILLFGNNLAETPDIVPQTVAIIERLVETGKLSSARLQTSCARIKALKSGLSR